MSDERPHPGAEALNAQRKWALPLHEEWRVEWDGEPMMGGGYWPQSSRAWRTLEDAETALKVLAQTSKKPNIHIAHRWAGEWERA